MASRASFGALPPAAAGLRAARGGPGSGINRSEQRRALALICLGIFGALSVWFCASAVLAPLATEWDFSETEGSFLTSIVNVGFCAGCLLSVAFSLSDLVHPPLLILLGSVGAGACNAGLLAVSGLGGALSLRFLVGFCLSLVYPPGVKLLATWFSLEQRGMSTGIMFSAFCLGSAFPNLLRGAAVDQSWKLVVLLTSLTSALGGILIFLLVPVGPLPFPASGPFRLSSCLAAVRNRRVGLAIAAYCGHMWELFCVWGWAATFLQQSWQLSSQNAPLVAFAVISMGGPGSWLGGILGDRYGRVKVASASLATSGTCIALVGALSDEGPLGVRIFIFLLWGLTALSDSPQFSALVIRHADQRYVGTAITLQMLCGYLMTVLALWVVPRIAQEISWRWSFFSLAAGPAASLIALACIGGDECEDWRLDGVKTPGPVVLSGAVVGLPEMRRDRE